ncbi:hypothetical protein AA19596_0797 [Acetobacter fabarum DSM 19596]|nr:hypothetical protein AA19596_0797 [Acetobacter fabarum DSM 19596]
MHTAPYNQAGGYGLRCKLKAGVPLVQVIQPRDTAQKHQSHCRHKAWERENWLACHPLQNRKKQPECHHNPDSSPLGCGGGMGATVVGVVHNRQPDHAPHKGCTQQGSARQA